MKKYFWDYAFLLPIAGTIIAFDQWTKYLVRTNLTFTESWAPWPWLEPYARIVFWKNTGAAFGIFQNMGSVFAVLAVIVSIAILYYFPQVPRSDWVLRSAMALQLGGAMGNFIDRVTTGYVTDFISFGTFAVFNIADASISTGVAILIVGMLIKERSLWLQERERQAKEKDEAAGDPGRYESSLPSQPEEAQGD